MVPLTIMRTALVALALAGCASAPATDYRPAVDSARPAVRTLMEKDRIPAAAVAVAVGDRVVWTEGFGVTDLTTKAPTRAETRFRVGSLTKLMTVAALMRLADQERLTLEDPVTRHLPDYPHGGVTLRQLAGHIGGVRHYGPGEFFNQTRYASATDSLRKFAAGPLIAPPGERYAYSSYGYDVLGAVIEKVTGKGFEAALRALVFDPLGMTATSFESDASTTSFYDNSKEGPKPSPAIDLTDRLPAGAAITTAGDLARLLIATSGGTFLSEASRRTMLTSQRLTDGRETNVGIGWRIATDGEGRLYAHHGGAVTGGRGTVAVYLAERVGVVILTNLGFASFDEKDALAIAAPFLAAGSGPAGQ